MLDDLIHKIVFQMWRVFGKSAMYFTIIIMGFSELDGGQVRGVIKGGSGTIHWADEIPKAISLK